MPNSHPSVTSSVRDPRLFLTCFQIWNILKCGPHSCPRGDGMRPLQKFWLLSHLFLWIPYTPLLLSESHIFLKKVLYVWAGWLPSWVRLSGLVTGCLDPFLETQWWFNSNCISFVPFIFLTFQSFYLFRGQHNYFFFLLFHIVWDPEEGTQWNISGYPKGQRESKEYVMIILMDILVSFFEWGEKWWKRHSQCFE